MLRINLLPSYVGQRRLTRRLIVGFAIAVIICVIVPMGIWIKAKSDLATLTDQATQAVAGKAITDGLKAKATTTLAGIGPIKAKLDFVDQVNTYTRKWVALYNTLADSSPRASLIYTDASVSGTTMTIKAYAPSIAEVGRYLQVMYQEPDFTSVSIDKIPGYPDALTHKYYLDGKLVFADSAKGGGATGSSPIQGGGASGSPNTPPPNFNPASLSPTGSNNIPADVGPPPVELTGGASTGGASIGSPSAGGGASASYSQAFLNIVNHRISPFATPAVRDQLMRQQLKRVVMKTEPRGFDITVTATLKQALSPPAVPSGGGGGPAAPGRGGPAGMAPPGGPPGSSTG